MARTAVRTLNELAGLIGAVVLIAGCGAPISAPVLRSPALFLFSGGLRVESPSVPRKSGWNGMNEGAKGRGVVSAHEVENRCET
jgi:hypothetical protein